MRITRSNGIAPVSPVHPIYKDPPRPQNEANLKKDKDKDLEKAFESFKSVLKTEKLVNEIKPTKETSQTLSDIKHKIIALRYAINEYKKVLDTNNDSSFKA